MQCIIEYTKPWKHEMLLSGCFCLVPASRNKQVQKSFSFIRLVKINLIFSIDILQKKIGQKGFTKLKFTKVYRHLITLRRFISILRLSLELTYFIMVTALLRSSNMSPKSWKTHSKISKHICGNESTIIDRFWGKKRELSMEISALVTFCKKPFYAEEGHSLK